MAKEPKKPAADETKTADETVAETPQDVQGNDGHSDDDVTEVTETPEPLRHGKQPTRLRDAQHSHQRKSHVADIDERFEQMLIPSTWAHVAKEVRVGDQIEVHAADGTWFGELYVRSVGRTEVHVAPIRYVEFKAPVNVTDDTPYAVQFRGPHMKWCVIARETKSVIKPDFDTEAEAGAWVAQHLKAIAA